MARVMFFALVALLVAAASAFVMPAAPRSLPTRQVASSGVADALASDIDYESQIKTMELEATERIKKAFDTAIVEAKERIKKAFDEATVKSDAEAKERWAKLEGEMKAAAASVGL
ncbi:hypothetical protein JKP88DRAFT_351713 [Tribonema minus]|uniref:Uncharacterized protein n=1 Tax=Tribonema minus TaxID=303371 RepID=A0A836C7K0_9STRA|nr:hypothetical protein JKP88DRAFT_351713 [Tribonema minus]